jgi:hypothetical protein
VVKFGEKKDRGFHAFKAEDAAIYFGCDDETRAVIERLYGRRTQGTARAPMALVPIISTAANLPP